MIIVNVILALIAYTAIILAVVLFIKDARIENNCNQDCNQGRSCDCDD